nr:response regulator [uncultured Methanobacterium sp.]
MSAKILVVEDERILALSLKKKLEKLGYTVTGTVSTGEDAIENAKNNEPDLVLMDIVLKGEIDGIETAAIINDLQDVPIVYLTAYADDEIIKRAVDTCPYGYIMKPYKDREIKANIEMALHKHKVDKTRFMDFEDVYTDVTNYIQENDEPIKKALFKEYDIEEPLNIDIGQNKIYVSTDRTNKELYSAFFDLLPNLMSKFSKSDVKLMVYSKGDELCLEFDKTSPN